MTALVLVAILGSMTGYIMKSAYANCTLAPNECYRVKEKCPVTQDQNCHVTSGTWWHVSTFFTHYKCEGTTSTVKDCDVDNNNKNNICASVREYASFNDCQAGINSTGSSTIVSGALCNGSDPCV
jgi:hypothetical protein